MTVLLGEQLIKPSNIIAAAQEIAVAFEVGEVPLGETEVHAALEILNDRRNGASVNGAKDVIISSVVGYTIPADAADIEFMPDHAIEEAKLSEGWFKAHLHSIEWISSLAFYGFGARVFELESLRSEITVQADTAFFPVLSIRTVLARN